MATCATDRIEKQKKIVDKWYDNKLITSATHGDAKFFKKMFYTATGEDYDYGSLPSMRKLKKFDVHVDKFAKRLVKNVGPFARYFYLPDEIVKNNPVASNAFDGFKIAHDYFRGNKEKYDKTIVDMAKSLQRIAQVMAKAKDESTPNIKKAAKLLEKDYRNYYAELSKGNHAEADRQWEAIVESAKKTQFQVFDEADAVLRNRKLMVTHSAKYARYKPVVKYWDSIKDKLFGSLGKGLDEYIGALKKVDNPGMFDNMIVSLTKLRNAFDKKRDYFPTDVIEVFPTVARVQELLYDRDIDTKNDADMNDITAMDKYVSNAVEKILSSLKVPGSVTQTQSQYPSHKYSKNLLGVMDNYVRSVTRFNYQVHTTSILADAVQKLGTVTDNEQLNGTSKFLLDYLYDTHSAMMGMHIQSKGWRAAVRGITAWEFISKLGFNMRGALRNATQSLQNWVYFGAKGMHDAWEHVKQYELTDALNKEMEKHGVFFTETRELANSIGLFPEIEISKIDGKEVPTFKFDTASSKFLGGLEKVAKFSGKPMQFVENKINRQSTFKIAFGLHHSALLHNKGRIERMINENKGKFEGKDLQDKIDKHIVRESGRFASEMVRELHYEYAPFAKPKVLRTPAGSILGQFMTYSVNFYNYNRKIISKGVEDIGVRDVWGQDAWRMYRLGMLYTTINGILSPLFNTDIGNLVQHDTYDRINQYYTWLMGDEEAKKKAFFGKGPIIGTAGGPFVSDLITLGNLAGFYDLLKDAEGGDRSALGYLAGYQDFSEHTGMERAFEFTRTVNTELGRTLFHTLPRMWDGASLGTLVFMEAALHPSKEMKERKATYIETLQDWGIPVPDTRYMEEKSKKRKPVKDRPNAEVMQSLTRLSKLS